MLRSHQAEKLRELENSWSQEYDRLVNLSGTDRLNLDLSRGKPSPEQLELSNPLASSLKPNELIAGSGIDTRNYGELSGIPEAKRLGATIMGVPEDEIIAAGNSSLTLMYITLSTAMKKGLWGDTRKWENSSSPKVLAPVPGYDRHFTMSEFFDLQMINIDYTDQSLDTDQIAQAVSQDNSVKAIWCVPKYGNPTGITLPDETVEFIADLPNMAAANDFVVLWDNAYAVHDLSPRMDTLASIREAALSKGTLDHIVQFASTSKITFAGAGVGFLSASNTVRSEILKYLSILTVGPDKVNQLRHARFLDNKLETHMSAHADILRPKFDLVSKILEEELSDLAIADWTKPNGGYFVSFDVMDGLAKEIVHLAKDVGLTLTPAGATFPYGIDPKDKNIRIAPTFAKLSELESAMKVLTLCTKLASARKILNQGRL